MSSLNDKIFSPASDLFQIIVPVYNEKSILETTLGHAKGYGYLKNLVVVNDASTDTTRDILDQWLTEESLRVLHLDINKKKRRGNKGVDGVSPRDWHTQAVYRVTRC